MSRRAQPVRPGLVVRGIANFVLAAVFLQPAPAGGQPPVPVRLGAIVSLTGDAAENGDDWFKGARLAVEEAAGEGLGIELMVEDDGSSPSRVVAAYKKLVNADRVQGVVGGTWDFLAETAFPLAAQAQLPFLTPTNPIEVFSVSARENPWVFTNGLSIKAAVASAAGFLSRRNLKRLAIIAVEVPYGLRHANLLRRAIEDAGGKVIFERRITYQGFKDEIRLAAIETRKNAPDAVFLVLNYAGVDAYLREIEGLAPRPVTLMTHTLLEAFQFGNSPSRFVNAFGIYQTLSDDGFASRFESRWGRSAVGYAPNGYDATLCLARAIAAGAFPLRDDASYTCRGVSGIHRFSKGSRELVDTASQIMQIRGGSLLPAGQE